MRGCRISIAAAALLLLAGCEVSPGGQVRQSNEAPDQTLDTTHVSVFRNPSGTPNLMIFCAGPFRFAATLSDRGSLARIPEDDAICRGGAS